MTLVFFMGKTPMAPPYLFSTTEMSWQNTIICIMCERDSLGAGVWTWPQAPTQAALKDWCLVSCKVATWVGPEMRASCPGSSPCWPRLFTLGNFWVALSSTQGSSCQDRPGLWAFWACGPSEALRTLQPFALLWSPLVFTFSTPSLHPPSQVHMPPRT